MRKSRFIFLVFIFMLSSQVFAAIHMTQPKVDGVISTNIEQGATFRVTIVYDGDGAPVNAMKFWLKYDATKLDIYNQRGSSPVSLGYYLHKDSIFNYQQEDVDENLGIIKMSFTMINKENPWTLAEDRNILTLTFHVKKSASVSDGQKLIWWWDEFEQGLNITDFVTLWTEGNVKITPDEEDITDIALYNIKAGADPVFAGLSQNDNDMYDGDKAASKSSVGNTVTIDWSSAVTNSDMTLFTSNNLLRYHIYRQDSPKIPYVEFTLGDNYLFKEGNSNGTYNNAVDLKDGSEYFYKVNAVDNTDVDGTPNDLDYTSSDPNENDTSFRKVIPTDTTAPNAPSLSIKAGDQKNILTISGYAPDAGGIVIIRRDDGQAVTAAPANGIATGADKATYEHGDVVSEGASLLSGKVIFAGFKNENNKHGNTSFNAASPGGIDTTFTDTGLINGKIYNYRIVVYDRAVGTIGQPGVAGSGDLVEMGRNYSASSDNKAMAPGLAPDAIADFYSISSPEAGEITLYWTNPIENFGGVVFFASDDLTDKWGNVSNDENNWLSELTLADGDPKKTRKLLTYYLPADNQDQVLGVEMSHKLMAATDNLDVSKVYFFKAFAFNNTGAQLEISDQSNNVAAFRFSNPAQAAAIPALAAGAVQDTTILYVGTTPEVTINLQKKQDGYGINTIVFPVLPMYDDENKSTSISTVKDLVDLINAKAGESVVTTFGYWDKTEQKPIGFVYNPQGNVKEMKGTDLAPEDIQLQPYVGYQIYVSETVPTFKLVGGAQD